MGLGNFTPSGERDYFDGRLPEYTYVSESFKSIGDSDTTLRFVTRKVIAGGQEHLERVKVKGEYLLHRSETGHRQVRLLVTEDDASIVNLTIQGFLGTKPEPFAFTFDKESYRVFKEVLDAVKFIDYSNKNKFRVNNAEVLIKGMMVDGNEQQLIEFLRSSSGSDREALLDSLRDDVFKPEDINVLTGRKKGLQEFHVKMAEGASVSERQWQAFFETNSWIFGYGLDYRFLGILQREARVSGVDVDGKHTVTSDFLLGTSHFTVIVENKLPTTPLFGSSVNRSHTWSLSRELMDGVSQILAQKVEWEEKSRREHQFTEDGSRIHQLTRDPRAILVIGRTDQFNGSDREALHKAQTFELFRRNLRNVEILTYDELFERAEFIVKAAPQNPMQYNPR